VGTTLKAGPPIPTSVQALRRSVATAHCEEIKKAEKTNSWEQGLQPEAKRSPRECLDSHSGLPDGIRSVTLA
jgi:hypothetical protein